MDIRDEVPGRGKGGLEDDNNEKQHDEEASINDGGEDVSKATMPTTCISVSGGCGSHP